MAQARMRTRSGRVRSKLDSRLGLLLSLPLERLRALKAHEDQKVERLAEELRSVAADLERAPDERARVELAARLEALDRRRFAPMTTGVHFPPASRKARTGPVNLREPYLSVFLSSEASAKDLEKLGVRVRSQAGDVFTAFVPIARIPRLEASPAIRFIELARPLLPTLDAAIPYTQINTLHAALPAVKGAGVVIGIVDYILDIFHPDFRTASDATRLLYLWDQTLTPQGAEQGPPTDPVLPGFLVGHTTYGVEYDQAAINTELTSANPPLVPAYQTVRHFGGSDHVENHGTLVTGAASGNGRGQPGPSPGAPPKFLGAAPEADIIFVSYRKQFEITGFADSVDVTDGFAYIFARASQLGKPCVVNLSNSDNQGPHDGTTLGEQFLDGLLLTPGRAITLSSGNSNGTSSHAAGSVSPGGTSNLTLKYQGVPTESDAVEIWYDRHDRFDVTVTVPTPTATVIGPVTPGNTTTSVLPNGVQVKVASVLNDPRNNDNFISITFVVSPVPPGQSIPTGNTTIALTGTTVINGRFNAWVDRNNRGLSAWQAPFLQEDQLTLGVPSTARRPITVGAHNKTAPTPGIYSASGRGPTRDGRIKPEIVSVGTNMTAPRSRDKNAAVPGPLYPASGKFGTSYSAALVAGACALLFQCRGASATWANLKQILENTAGTAGLSIPSNAFGFGFMQMANACAQPAPNVDIWLRDDATDTGLEPFTGPVAWLSPDIEVLDTAGNPVPNPTYNPNARFNNLVRVTIRNRGTQTARNTEVYLYWADPATNLPFPGAWSPSGLYTDPPPGFAGGTYTEQGNKIVIAQLAAGNSTQVLFAWAPPAPGGNLRGDNHFCLLVRLENESDPSGVSAGGWAVLTAKNNVALRNVLVQQSPAEASFYVVGSDDQDSLMVSADLVGGQVELALPVQALPWRDIRVIERHGRRRLPYGGERTEDPVAKLTLTLNGADVRLQTDVVGAQKLEVRDGMASILAAEDARLFVPHVRLAPNVRMPARIRVLGPQTDERRRFVHVTQLSGGQLVGGITLELLAKQDREGDRNDRTRRKQSRVGS
jgi:hypothetical protein